MKKFKQITSYYLLAVPTNLIERSFNRNKLHHLGTHLPILSFIQSVGHSLTHSTSLNNLSLFR